MTDISVCLVIYLWSVLLILISTVYHRLYERWWQIHYWERARQSNSAGACFLFAVTARNMYYVQHSMDMLQVEITTVRNMCIIITAVPSQEECCCPERVYNVRSYLSFCWLVQLMCCQFVTWIDEIHQTQCSHYDFYDINLARYAGAINWFTLPLPDITDFLCFSSF